MAKGIFVSIIAVLITVSDLISKYVVFTQIQVDDQITLVPNFLNLTHHHNKGAAFGMLGNLPPNLLTPFFTIVIAMATVVIAVLVYQTEKTKRIELTAMALVLGGGLGNFINRYWLGHVVDFISVHWRGEYHFPTFNLADIAICTGVGILALLSFKKTARQPD